MDKPSIVFMKKRFFSISLVFFLALSAFAQSTQELRDSLSLLIKVKLYRQHLKAKVVSKVWCKVNHYSL